MLNGLQKDNLQLNIIRFFMKGVSSLKKKEKYCEAEIDVILVNSADVITTSEIGDNGFDEEGWA